MGKQNDIFGTNALFLSAIQSNLIMRRLANRDNLSIKTIPPIHLGDKINSMSSELFSDATYVLYWQQSLGLEFSFFFIFSAILQLS